MRMMDIYCILAAAFFVVGNLMKLIYYAKEVNGNFSWWKLEQLDEKAIKEQWAFRSDNKARLTASAVINSLAWLLMCFPLIQLAYVLSSQKGAARYMRLHTGIVVLTLAGAFTEWIATFIFLGGAGNCLWMAEYFKLNGWLYDFDDTGWKVLEMIWMALRGMISWADAFEWVALFFVLIFIHMSVRKYRDQDPATFGAGWNALGLFIALVALLEFGSEILRNTNWELFSKIAFWYAMINRLIMIPVWLVLLGFRLPHAAAKMDKDESDLELSETAGPI